jgi:hypothetical protein
MSNKRNTDYSDCDWGEVLISNCNCECAACKCNNLTQVASKFGTFHFTINPLSLQCVLNCSLHSINQCEFNVVAFWIFNFHSLIHMKNPLTFSRFHFIILLLLFVIAIMWYMYHHVVCVISTRYIIWPIWFLNFLLPH